MERNAATNASGPTASITPSTQNESGEVIRTAGVELEVRPANQVEQALTPGDDAIRITSDPSKR